MASVLVFNDTDYIIVMFYFVHKIRRIGFCHPAADNVKDHTVIAGMGCHFSHIKIFICRLDLFTGRNDQGFVFFHPVFEFCVGSGYFLIQPVYFFQ